MSTRSRIGILQENGSVKSIYCHYDGYPEYTGKILANNYTSPAEVDALIERGDLRCVNPDSSDNEHYKDTRGEEYAVAIISSDVHDYLGDAKESWGEYAYLYRDGEWEVCSTYGDEGFQNLSQVLTNNVSA